MSFEIIATYWEGFLDVVEPHLPEYLHWNEICVSKTNVCWYLCT